MMKKINLKPLFFAFLIPAMATFIFGIVTLLVLMLLGDADGVSVPVFSVAIPLLATYFFFPLSLKQVVFGRERALFTKKNFFLLVVFVSVVILTGIFGWGFMEDVEMSLWESLIVTYGVVAFSEEFLYRHVVQELLEEARLPVYLVLLIQAFLFAFLNHNGGDLFANLLIRFPAGILLGLLKRISGTIFFGVMVHYLYNMSLVFID